MITIRKISVDEISRAKRLLSETWTATYGSYLKPETIEQVTNTWHSIENLTNQAQDKDAYFAVAKNEDDKIVGICTAKKLDEQKVYIARIYVLPSCQGQGVGRKLLYAIFDYFPQVSVFHLEVEKFNANAIGFYEKYQFKVIGERVDKVNGEKLQTVAMEKQR
jgi:ribosomal protein S18 acetylase RimI-like enzyme